MGDGRQSGRRTARLGHAAFALYGRGDHGAELLEVHGLGQVIEGAAAQGLHRVLGRAVGGHDDGALAAALVAQLAQQLHAAAIGQAHVGDQYVKTAQLQLRAGLGQGAGRFDTVALAQQCELIQRAQIGFVVNDKDGGEGSDHGGDQTTIGSNREAVSGWRCCPRKCTVKALPGCGPRAVGRSARA